MNQPTLAELAQGCANRLRNIGENLPAPDAALRACLQQEARSLEQDVANWRPDQPFVADLDLRVAIEELMAAQEKHDQQRIYRYGDTYGSHFQEEMEPFDQRLFKAHHQVCQLLEKKPLSQDDDYAELRSAAAKVPTQSNDWGVVEGEDARGKSFRICSHFKLTLASVPFISPTLKENARAVAHYIAAAHPVTIEKLLKERDDLKEELEKLKDSNVV